VGASTIEDTHRDHPIRCKLHIQVCANREIATIGTVFEKVECAFLITLLSKTYSKAMKEIVSLMVANATP